MISRRFFTLFFVKKIRSPSFSSSPFSGDIAFVGYNTLTGRLIQQVPLFVQNEATF
jgi:hypothetical protein